MTDRNGDVVNLAIERAKRGLAPTPDPLSLLTTGQRVDFDASGVSGFVDKIERDGAGNVIAAVVMVLGRRLRMTPDRFIVKDGAA
jgi:hypothetical protein